MRLFSSLLVNWEVLIVLLDWYTTRPLFTLFCAPVYIDIQAVRHFLFFYRVSFQVVKVLHAA